MEKNFVENGMQVKIEYFVQPYTMEVRGRVYPFLKQFNSIEFTVKSEFLSPGQNTTPNTVMSVRTPSAECHNFEALQMLEAHSTAIKLASKYQSLASQMSRLNEAFEVLDEISGITPENVARFIELASLIPDLSLKLNGQTMFAHLLEHPFGEWATDNATEFGSLEAYEKGMLKSLAGFFFARCIHDIPLKEVRSLNLVDRFQRVISEVQKAAFA